jgi:hypothetical protein
MLHLNNRLPDEVNEMFAVYKANDIVGLLEDLDIFLVNQGVRRNMDMGFEQHYATVLYLLKKSVRALGAVSGPAFQDHDN